MVREDHHLDRRHLLEDRVFLKRPYHTLAGDHMWTESRDVLAVEAYPTSVRPLKGGDELEECALARAIGADDGENRLLLDAEAQLVDRGQAAKAFGKIIRFKKHGDPDG